MYDNEYIFTDRPSLCYTNQKITGFSKSGDQATDTPGYMKSKFYNRNIPNKKFLNSDIYANKIPSNVVFNQCALFLQTWHVTNIPDRDDIVTNGWCLCVFQAPSNHLGNHKILMSLPQRHQVLQKQIKRILRNNLIMQYNEKIKNNAIQIRHGKFQPQ